MKKIIHAKLLIAFAIAAAFIGIVALPVFAQGTDANEGIRVKVDANGTVNVGGLRVNIGADARTALSAEMKTRALTRADQEIDRRLSKLTEQRDRIRGMVRLSGDGKNSLDASVTAQISELENLKTKIHADTDAAAFRADIQSITKSYRTFALVIPKAAIIAAADRVMAIAKSVSELSVKLEARIDAAASAGKGVSSLRALLTDMQSKALDANTEAFAAVNAVTALSPDNGDQATMQANLRVLQDARMKVRTAQNELVAARKDADGIIRGLWAFGLSASATTKVSSSVDGR